jgi:Ca-activated chloride channel homolog
MNGLTWVEPQWLWLLALVPVAAGLKAWELARRRRARLAFSEGSLMDRLNPDQTAGPGTVWRLGAYTLALALMVLAVARPAGRPEAVEEKLTRTGIDIMLAVDLSSSMKATDLAPNRMQAAKTALKEFIGKLETDPVGLTVFAGSVSLQCPLTLDHRTAAMMVDIINTDFLPVDGTALGDALAFALDKIGAADRKGAVIVLLTDGENTRGAPPLEAAKKAKEAGTRVYTVGIGTPGGAQIPDGVDAQGRPKVKMYQGAPVVTKLDEDLLRQIADETGGKYFYAQTSQALLSAYGEISRLTKTAHEEKKQRFRYQERYLWPLVPALLCLLFDTLAAVGWPGRRRRQVEAGRV